MTISALMAVYNREDTVEEAIESIASQLSNEDELIISNDESTDNTLLICKEMQKKYPFIQIIEHHRTNVDDHMFFLIDKATKDISVICDKSKLTDRGCSGAPDWIIEVISPSTQSLDYLKKLWLYQKHNVREYWIINPTTKSVLTYDFDHGESTGYTFDDQIPAAIYGSDLKIRISDLL